VYIAENTRFLFSHALSPDIFYPQARADPKFAAPPQLAAVDLHAQAKQLETLQGTGAVISNAHAATQATQQ